MTNPNPGDLQVACEALRSDADKWWTASDDMAAATDEAQNLVLGKQQLGWVGEERGVVDAYARLQEKMTGLLTGAADEFDKIAMALWKTFERYDQSDEASANRFSKVQE